MWPWENLFPSLGNSLLIPGINVIVVKEGRIVNWCKMLSTTFNIQPSLKTSSHHGTKTHSHGNGDHFRWKKTTSSFVSPLCLIHTNSPWAHHTIMQFIYLYRLLDKVLLQSKGCALKFSLHSQNLLGPLEHNSYWIHKFFLGASCSNPPRWMIQIQYYGHISLFSSLSSGKKREKYYKPGDEN